MKVFVFIFLLLINASGAFAQAHWACIFSNSVSVDHDSDPSCSGTGGALDSRSGQDKCTKINSNQGLPGQGNETIVGEPTCGVGKKYLIDAVGPKDKCRISKTTTQITQKEVNNKTCSSSWAGYSLNTSVTNSETPKCKKPASVEYENPSVGNSVNHISGADTAILTCNKGSLKVDAENKKDMCKITIPEDFKTLSNENCNKQYGSGATLKFCSGNPGQGC